MSKEILAVDRLNEKLPREKGTALEITHGDNNKNIEQDRCSCKSSVNTAVGRR